MGHHLRYSGLPEPDQIEAVRAIVLDNADLAAMLQTLRTLSLPDCWIASGAIYQNIWNVLTGRPNWYGVKDIDIIYFDDRDISYEAEDDVINCVDAAIANPPVPLEVRNQARVHLWFGEKFGFDVPPLTSSLGSLLRYASRSHAVAVRLDDNGHSEIAAPFGLDDILSFRVTPNPAFDNRKAHTAKAERAQQHWPEVQTIPWPT